MGLSSQQQVSLFRNLICASLGLLLLFTTAVFVITGVYQQDIDDKIDAASLLKEYTLIDAATSSPAGHNSRIPLNRAHLETPIPTSWPPTTTPNRDLNSDQEYYLTTPSDLKTCRSGRATKALSSTSTAGSSPSTTPPLPNCSTRPT